VELCSERSYEPRVSKSSKLSQPPVAKPAVGTPDPLSFLNLKSLGLRVGLPLLGIWAVAIFVVGKAWALIGAGALTALAVGLLGWAMRFANKSRAVASIVQGADTAEGRKLALNKLDTDFKKGDTAAIFARAQLQLHDDPRQALATLEQIDLGKVMAPVADEARAQRAMIHLVLGEPERARQLVDPIDLSRHQQPKTRATLVTVIAEAWARTGQGKKAIDTLSVFDPEDAEYVDLRAQLYRAYAFAYAAVNDTKGIRRVLRKLAEINPQILGAFIAKKIHPLLEREAKELLKRTGGVPRRSVVRRM
jgi:hypothetical protein